MKIRKTEKENTRHLNLTDMSNKKKKIDRLRGCAK